MLGISLVEWLGYFASVLVAFSLTMSSILKLRWLNLTGFITFTIYGFLIWAVPVLMVNSLIVLVNVYFLVRMYTRGDFFKVMEIKPDSLYLGAFLDFHDQEIRKEFPQFSQ